MKARIIKGHHPSQKPESVVLLVGGEHLELLGEGLNMGDITAEMSRLRALGHTVGMPIDQSADDSQDDPPKAEG